MNAQLHAQMQKATDKYIPQYLCEGNYCVCLLLTPRKQIASFGIAKRNPNYDKFNAERGREIALARAVKKMSNGKTSEKKKK